MSRDELQMATTERVRSLAAELHALRDYTDTEMDYFELIEDLLVAIKIGFPPENALRLWKKQGARKDYHVYKGDGGDCQLCGARLEYWVHC